MASVLIVGGDGLIGAALAFSLAHRGWTVFQTSRRASPRPNTIPGFDLANPTLLEAELPQVDLAIFSAAMARFADCRAAPDLARAINVSTPVALAERLARQGTRSILISTSAVFDGAQPRPAADSPTTATSLYGSLKAEAEKGFLALSGRGGVVRLTKVLEPNQALLAGWSSALRRNETIDAFDDLRLAPISLSAVETGILAAAEGASIIQVSPPRDVSYFEAASFLAKSLRVPETLVRPASAAKRGIPECDRPPNATLDTSELSARTGWVPTEPLDLIERIFVRGLLEPIEQVSAR